MYTVRPVPSARSPGTGWLKPSPATHCSQQGPASRCSHKAQPAAPSPSASDTDDDNPGYELPLGWTVTLVDSQGRESGRTLLPPRAWCLTR